MQPHPGQHPYGGYPTAYPPVYPQAYPGSPYGAAGYGYGYGLPRPVAVAPVVQTSFGVALVEVTPTSSGPAAASLVTGIAAALVSLVVAWFAVAGAQDGWGPKVAGAFAVLTTLLCAAAVGLAGAALRRIRTGPAWGAVRGRGVAIAGLVCGIAGFGVSGIVMLTAVLR